MKIFSFIFVCVLSISCMADYIYDPALGKIRKSDSANSVFSTQGNCLVPRNDAFCDLGSGTLMWKDLYLSNQLKIGTSSSTYDIHAYKSDTATMRLNTANGTGGSLYASTDDGGGGLLIRSANINGIGSITSFIAKPWVGSSWSSSIDFWTGTYDSGTYRRMTIANNGYIGIGTDSPEYPLHVTASRRTSYPSSYGYLSATGAGYGMAGTGNTDVSLYTTGRIWTSAEVDTLSDRRAKKEIKELDTENALDIVDNLRAVSFVWDDGREDTSPKLGWIAQEVGEAGIGEAVTLGTGKIRNEEGEIEEVNDLHLIDKDQINAVLWAAVRELSKQNKDIKKSIAVLECKVLILFILLVCILILFFLRKYAR